MVYALRSFTETESRYARACEHFSDYILGKSVEVEFDHKPLIPLLNSKNLDTLPARVLRFRLRLMRFDYVIHHVPGKSLYTADALSRVPLSHSKSDCHSPDFI